MSYPHDNSEDPDGYVEKVRQFLAPMKGQFNYYDMLKNFTDKSIYYDRVGFINTHRTVENASVLSNGCGVGGALVAYKDFGARVVFGTEIEPAYAGLAAIRIGHFHNTKVILYDGYNLPFADDTFDIVDSMHVVEHTKEPKEYIDEVLRVLKPEGVAYIEFPNRLFPYEQHCKVPLVTLLPKRCANVISSSLSRMPFISTSLAFRLKVVKTISERYLSLAWLFFSLRKKSVEIEYVPPGNPVLRKFSKSHLVRFFLPNRFVRVFVTKI